MLMERLSPTRHDFQGKLAPPFVPYPRTHALAPCSGLVPVIQYVNAKGFKFGLVNFAVNIAGSLMEGSSASQYTDGGVYTCNKGGRPYNIPGSYGEWLCT